MQAHPFIKDDFALLVLRKRHKRPFLRPVAANASSVVETSGNVYFSAFDDAETPQNLMYRVCKAKGVSYGLLYQECSTENGASGAGVYMQVYDLIQNKWDRVVSDCSEVIELPCSPMYECTQINDSIGLLPLTITWYKSAMLEGKLIIIHALGHQNKGKSSFTGSGLFVLMSQCGNNNELALQHGGYCTT